MNIKIREFGNIIKDRYKESNKIYDFKLKWCCDNLYYRNTSLIQYERM